MGAHTVEGTVIRTYGRDDNVHVTLEIFLTGSTEPTTVTLALRDLMPAQAA
jgi:hypothetical protein